MNTGFHEFLKKAQCQPNSGAARLFHSSEVFGGLKVVRGNFLFLSKKELLKGLKFLLEGELFCLFVKSISWIEALGSGNLNCGFDLLVIRGGSDSGNGISETRRELKSSGSLRGSGEKGVSVAEVLFNGILTVLIKELYPMAGEI